MENKASALQAEIDEMKELIAAPTTGEEMKRTFKTALAEMETELKGLKASAAPSAPAPVKKKVTEAELKAHLTAKFNTLTNAGMKKLTADKYKKVLAEIEDEIKTLTGASSAKRQANKFVAKWMPKGKQAVKPTVTKSAAKPTPKPTSKRAAKTPPVKKPASSIAAKNSDPSDILNYMKKVNPELAERLKPACLQNLYMVIADQDYTIERQKEVVKTGEVIIVNEDNYFVTSFTKRSAARCKIGRAVSQSELKKVTAENEELKAEIVKLKGKTTKSEGKPAKSKPSSAKPSASKTTGKKRAKCSADDLESAKVFTKVMKFAEKYTMGWHNKSNKIDIVGIYGVKETGRVIVKVKDYRGIRLSAGIFWYELCLDRLELTKKIPAPKKGSYRQFEGLKTEKLRELYTKNEPRPQEYKKYMEYYRSLLACSAEKSCDTGNKWKDLRENYGNIIKNTVNVPEHMKELHSRTRAARKKGEKYYDAMARVVAAETKAQQTA